MAGPRIDEDTFEALGDLIEPPPPPPIEEGRMWAPILTPEQQTMFDSTSRYILAWSEKGSGKTVGATMKMVRHCYENNNALGIILVRVKSMANKGGAFDKLMGFTLPAWRDGNRDKEGNLIDEGLGLQFSDVKFDAQHNEMVYIQNQYGGWSKIILISAPHAHQLRDRIRGYEPSIVFIDELTSTDSEIYFTAVAAQIGRVIGIKNQQFIGACNPEGESHWVYQTWFVNAFDEETGIWDPDFERIYFPVASNADNLQAGYLDSLKKIYRNDSTEAARMIEGQWRDRPSGEGLFAGLFNQISHIAPLDSNGIPDPRNRLMPVPGHCMIIGADPGSVYNAFTFAQWLPIDGKLKWVVFDEICIFKKRVDYAHLVPMIMRRIRWWRDTVGSEMPMVWMSDDTAFNVWRAAQGSFDVLEIQKIYEAHRALYRLEPTKVKPCPAKGDGSKKARVRILQTALAQDEIVVSSACVHVKKMLEHLRSAPQKDSQPFDPDLAMKPMRSDHIHVFDALTYPMIAGATQPSLLQPPRQGTQTLTSVRAA